MESTVQQEVPPKQQEVVSDAVEETKPVAPAVEEIAESKKVESFEEEEKEIEDFDSPNEIDENDSLIEKRLEMLDEDDEESLTSGEEGEVSSSLSDESTIDEAEHLAKLLGISNPHTSEKALQTDFSRSASLATALGSVQKIQKALSIKKTPLEDIPQMHEECVNAFVSHKSLDYDFRMTQLTELYKMMWNHEEEIVEALRKDFHQPFEEAKISEVFSVRNEIVTALKSLKTWMKGTKPSVPILNRFDGCRIIPEPLGTVLIIGNHFSPFKLLLRPLASAIAAGNAVILKPSDLTPHSSALLAELLPRYIDQTFYKIVLGGAEELAELLMLRFDKIMYAGKRAIGKTIMQAAARYLTPVTLELGGQNPCIVDFDCKFEVAARRIMWGRCVFGGQEMTAPNYILCTAETQPRLVAAFRKIIKEFYGEDPQESKDLCRIVNKEHFYHVRDFLACGEAIIGGETDEDDLYVAPTVLINCDRMNETFTTAEIHAPIIPIIVVENMDDAIDFVNNRDKPYMTYVFSNNKKTCDKVIKHTFSGNAMANDTVLLSAVMQLPLSGVGDSGLGECHGKFGFESFSHNKSTMSKALKREIYLQDSRYPPYSPRKLKNMMVLYDRRIKLKKREEQ